MLASVRGPVEIARWGEGPPVLLLHGAMGGWDQALLLARAAIGAEGFQFLAISRPGYLRTPVTTGPTHASQGDLSAAVLDALGIRQAPVVAVSGGGPCALEFALRHPERCSALVMIAACTAPVTRRVPLHFHLTMLMARIPPVLAWMRRKVASDPDSVARRGIPDPVLRAQTLNDPETGPLVREFLLSLVDRLPERLPGLRKDVALCRGIGRFPLEIIQAPALIIHGTDDEAVPFAQSKALAERLPHAELLPVPGGRHMTLFTHRALIQPRVREFLERHAH